MSVEHRAYPMRMSALGVSGARASGTGVPGRQGWPGPRSAGVGTRSERPDPEVPDTDEAGTGRRGAPHSGSKRPGHPVPDESTA